MIVLPPPADPLVMVGVGVLAYFVFVKWVEWLLPRAWTYRIALSRAVTFAWLALFGLVAQSGALQRFDRFPPPMAIMIVGVLIVSVAIGASSFGRNAMAMPLVSLIGLQAFRLPLELLMHRGVALGIVPVELSYTGYNFDIVTGIGAAAIALALSRGIAVPRRVIWLWNVYGLACLAVIVVVAVLGSPMVHRFGTDPRHVNTWVLFVPYVLVPTTLVVTALSAHLVITRALWRSA
ncbi:MAG: hypothetical protein EPO35_09375 [Acidobacteria bacterium]|nr:MAG: hypothetical protein EPO35_09375 [Acidobacteriota bacterium]